MATYDNKRIVNEAGEFAAPVSLQEGPYRSMLHDTD